jgi:ABC-type sugar transport system ATPase subunit
LTKAYDGVVAVDGVDVSIDPGTIVGLVGQNGAGKSTLIKILAGAVPPDSGEIVVDGALVRLAHEDDAHRLGFSFVHQELSDFPALSVAENVALSNDYPTKLRMVDWTTLRKQVTASLGLLDVQVDPRARAGSLSVADRRMVMIAAALRGDARMLVLDEPSAALTAPEISRLHAVLRQARDHGVAVVYVSHRLDEIVALCDRAVVMRGGRVVAEHAAADLTTDRLFEEISGVSLQDARRDLHSHSGAPGATNGSRTTAPSLRATSLTRSGVVEGVDLDVFAGEVVGIGGLVGSGRTELLRLLAGADTPTSGHVYVQGNEVSFSCPADALARGIALAPEDRRGQGLVEGFSVRQNITIAALEKVSSARLLRFPSLRQERRVTRRYLDELDIKASGVEQPVRTLSGGNQQKVVIARWLLNGADIVMFDEPTHGMDVGAKEQVFSHIRGLADDGKAVIVVTSELEDLERIADRVLVLKEGRPVGWLHGSAINAEAILARCYANGSA